jgi:hypothetical protein
MTRKEEKEIEKSGTPLRNQRESVRETQTGK